MILLDTDHATVLKYESGERYERLNRKILASDDPEIGTTVITVEEQMRGWMATIAKERHTSRQVNPYRQLRELFAFFAKLTIRDFTDRASEIFEEKRGARVRIDTGDLKIASIALANDALLLTANRRDFEKVPGLRFENWLDDPPPADPA